MKANELHDLRQRAEADRLDNIAAKLVAMQQALSAQVQRCIAAGIVPALQGDGTYEYTQE